MKIPLDVSFRNITKSNEMIRMVEDEVAKLEKVCHSIIRCRVVIEKLAKHPRSSKPYRVRIDITLPPNHEIVVKREPTKDAVDALLSAIVHDAFAAAHRQVQKIVERRHPKQREKRMRAPFPE